jgi:hypothetical protein
MEWLGRELEEREDVRAVSTLSMTAATMQPEFDELGIGLSLPGNNRLVAVGWYWQALVHGKLPMQDNAFCLA